MSKAYDAIIIGAGIIGCCIAFEMSKKGHRTLNLDFQPVAGAMMAALIDQVEQGYDHDASPLKYTLPHLGITIDLGAFHRKREINRDSSFSVIG